MRTPEAADVLDPLTRLVAVCLCAPERAPRLSVEDWNRLLPALRRNALLATFAERLAALDLVAAAPPKAQAHMDYARIAAASVRTAVRFEVNRMLRALRDYEGPLLLLKGAAYEFGALPPALGRMTGDVDVMVPRSRMDEVEGAFTKGGWRLTNEDPYDQHFYREWGHEIPALLHPHRQTPIDLHHTIARLTSRAHPDADALLAARVATAASRLEMLAPADMVLHSTLHLFNDEVGRPLRDLFDIHLLLVHFGGMPRFWADFLARAELHGVGRPVHYMLRQVRATFGTDVPAEVLAVARQWRPRATLDWSMERIFRMRFAAEGALGRQLRYRVVRRVHYVRAHWLRMPPMLLASHLTRKAVRRLRERLARAAPDTDNATA